MRNDWKSHWIEEYKKAYRIHKTEPNDYDRGIAFGRLLALQSTLYLDHGFDVSDIDTELEKEF